MFLLYAALSVYLVGRVVLALVGLVRARPEDIPAVVRGLALWWRQCDDVISRPRDFQSPASLPGPVWPPRTQKTEGEFSPNEFLHFARILGIKTRAH